MSEIHDYCHIKRLDGDVGAVILTVFHYKVNLPECAFDTHHHIVSPILSVIDDLLTSGFVFSDELDDDLSNELDDDACFGDMIMMSFKAFKNQVERLPARILYNDRWLNALNAHQNLCHRLTCH